MSCMKTEMYIAFFSLNYEMLKAFSIFIITDSLKPFEHFKSGVVHRCSYCSYTSPLKANVKRHLLVHTGEKPFSCNICQRRFAQKNYLQIHILAHTGERPYSCSFCQKRFTQKKYLQRH
ncbi:Chorion transcription factor Cf2, partial [Stegodyphus mimosarum]